MPEAAVASRRFAADGRYLRDPAGVIGFFDDGDGLKERLSYRASAGWWEALHDLQVSLLVTREYEHLLLSVGVSGDRPDLTFLRLPHPSGIAVDVPHALVHVALTRNPNQIVSFAPAAGDELRRTLWPVRMEFFAGGNYFHDIVLADGRLLITAVGRNSVLRVCSDGRLERAWWPRCIERDGVPDHSRNRIQLNSIAWGGGLESSYFTASTATPGRYDPGHLKFDPDGRGVLFEGRTREVLARGLTRPHSARLALDTVWVANSGYAELVSVSGGGDTEVVCRLPGWTRGLCIIGSVAIVGTSRVLPRFRHYAPGVTEAVCGLHAVDLGSGRVMGSLTWSAGNQIFAVEAVPRSMSVHLPYRARTSVDAARRGAAEFFYHGPTEYQER